MLSKSSYRTLLVLKISKKFIKKNPHRVVSVLRWGKGVKMLLRIFTRRKPFMGMAKKDEAIWVGFHIWSLFKNHYLVCIGHKKKSGPRILAFSLLLWHIFRHYFVTENWCFSYSWSVMALLNNEILIIMQWCVCCNTTCLVALENKYQLCLSKIIENVAGKSSMVFLTKMVSGPYPHLYIVM